MTDGKTHSGGCHCGRVRFEATTDVAQAIACNCSICSKQSLWLTFVKPAQFKLLSGLDAVGEYRFNKHVIHHVFCRTCGVEPFARGKAKDGHDMFAINVRCLDIAKLRAPGRSTGRACAPDQPRRWHRGFAAATGPQCGTPTRLLAPNSPEPG